ncbi:MarR family winged helix-turn-helix transcriptional regulator [Desulfospira joergensenii]|uniref:MarR family winged helix-turn-helix transcriptional regulator n=1 Tax=Desulfospira joergensenii TaxID=53329 RepID=UPI0003B48554|nr:MarR family transcriptional regulator [Desulfospira joergensenii]
MEENISMQIMMRLRQIIQEMSRHSKQLQEKYKTTLPQLICLKEVANHGPIAIGALTKIVFINNSTVTGIIDRLETRKLVQRVRISKDRRQIHVEITEEGLKFLENAPTPIHHQFIAKLENMKKEDVSMILWGLELLVDMLGQANPSSTTTHPPKHVMHPEEGLAGPNVDI